MSVVEERKALERMSEAARRIVSGARQAVRPPPAEQGEGQPPTGPQAGQGGAQTPPTPRT